MKKLTSMPLSKERERTRGRARRLALKRAAGAHMLSKADVRAIRASGLRVEDMEGEEGPQVSFQAFSALQRDRDALKAHLSWHHESMKNPDVGTIIERVRAEERSVSDQRIIQLEADLARIELMMDSMRTGGWREEKDYAKEYPPAIMHSTGYLLKSDRSQVIILQSRDLKNGNASDSISIPRSAVKKIIRLVRPGPL